MRISTKGRYGSRAMLTLAARYYDGPTRAAEIAETQDISLKYLESILATLKAAGLVSVKRGAGGGYQLSRPPEQITMLDILRPLEDFLGIVHCTVEDCDCARVRHCVTRTLWQHMKDATERVLSEKSLADLLVEGNGHAGRSVV